MKRFTLLLGIAAAAGLSSCYQSPEFINPVYTCECGAITLNGQNFPLKMAEAVVWDSLHPLSRRYHLIADMRTEQEVTAHAAAHDFTVTLEFDSINRPVFYIPADGILNGMQEINHGDDLFPERNFIATNAIIQPSPAFLGGTETVAFEMLIKETSNGTPVGFDIPLTGSFVVEIE